MEKNMNNENNQNNLFFGFFKIVSLSGIIIIVLLSQSIATTPRQLSLLKKGNLVSQQPTVKDSKVSAAQQAFNEGKQLYEQGTAEALRQALLKFQEALPLYQTLNDRAQQAETLSYIGLIYDLLGEKQKALEFGQQSLTLFRQLGDKSGEAILLNNIAKVYSDLKENQQAIDYYNQSLTLARDIRNQELELIIVSDLAAVYFGLGEQKKTLELFKQALQLSRNLAYKTQEIKLLQYIATIYQQIGEAKNSLEYYQQILNIYRTGGNKLEEANTLFAIGSIYENQLERQQAFNAYSQALSLYQGLGNTTQETHLLSNLIGFYLSFGDLDKAWEAYNKVSAVLEENAAKSENPIKQKILISQGQYLTNIGNSFKGYSYNQQALEIYKKAHLIFQDLEKETEGEILKAAKFGVAGSLVGMSSAYQKLGDRQQALNSLNQALPIFQNIGASAQEAFTLNNMGIVYDLLGETEKALDYYNKSLGIKEKMGLDSGSTLLNIGAAYIALANWETAFDYFNRSLKVAKETGNISLQITALNNLGEFYQNSENWQKALEIYQEILPITQKAGFRSDEAMIIHNLGKIYFAKKDVAKAQELYDRSLAIVKELDQKSLEVNILYSLAVLERERGDFNRAIDRIETAINIIENRRSKIGSQELRASYFAIVQKYYELYIDLLMQLHQQNPTKGYNAMALHASERTRARSLLELLTEANANIRQGVDPKLLEQEQKLQQQLNNFDHQKHQLLSTQRTQQQVDEIKQKIDTVLTQLDQLKAQIRTTSPRYADLKYPQPLILKEIQQQVLDDDTLLLQYSLGKDRSYLWIVSKNSITSHILPKRSDIEAAAQTFRQSLTSSEGKLETGLPLSQIILAPVASQLGNKRLLIVGDGVLQYIPFAALPIPTSPTTPLLVQNEIVTLPSASTLAIQRRQLQNRPTAAKTLAVIADPIFAVNDSRLANSSPQPTPETLSNYALTRATRNLGLGDSANLFDRLPHTRTEAEKILALVPEAKRLQALDFNASRTKATDPNLGEYQIVHLATHGLVDPVNPELSGIVLSLFDQQGKSQDGFLRLHDIFNLNLPVELVVLSACETGLGKEVKGEGLVGLTRGFMYAGSRRVVVSLWSVNDAATSELMAKFYQKLLQGGQNPLQALREAQLEMWNSPNRQSPYYWAAFTVQGDWQ
jgi:CHAT domain-containing protein